MRQLYQSPLRRLLAWRVHTRLAPSDLPDSLDLDPRRGVCFVLPTRGLADRLVLQQTCRDLGLREPRRFAPPLPGPGESTYLYLPTLVATRAPGSGDAPGDPAARLLARALQEPGFDLQVVPASVFWGRDPGRQASILKILFSDSERPSVLRKLFIILAQGRNSLLVFGRPFSLRTLAGDSTSLRRNVRKLVLLLRIHFRRQRNAALGPSLSHRNQVVRSLLRSPMVHQEVAAQSDASGESRDVARGRAAAIAHEIAADYSALAISLLERVLGWLWERTLDGIEVRHARRLRTIGDADAVVYVPAHRSHLDYLLLPYVLYQHGLVPPHIAAGRNLDFWPVGGLLRRGGAFYLRRDFKGDRLYGAVFRAYVDTLIHRGYSLTFFPEGGRSRSGRLLTPKAGLLAMVVRTALRHPDRPVLLLPLHINYDRLPEVGTYARELSGARKRRESVAQLFRARRILRTHYGRAYLSIGEPLPLEDFLTRRGLRGSDGAGPGDETALHVAVSDLAWELMRRINCTARLTPPALLGAVLLATPNRALPESECGQRMEELLALLRAQPYGADVTLPKNTGPEVLAQACAVTRLRRITHPWGDLLAAGPDEEARLAYYRNTGLHLFALPALLASLCLQPGPLQEKEVLSTAAQVYPFLRAELFLRWDRRASRRALRGYLEAFVKRGLVERTPLDGQIRHPPVASAEFGSLSALAAIMRDTWDRYALTASLVARHGEAGDVERDTLEVQSQELARRMAVLTGREAPEFFDPAVFETFVDTLSGLGLISPRGPDAPNLLWVDPQVAQVALRCMQLPDADARRRIVRLVADAPLGTEDGEAVTS